jgi:hypothetical protein
MQRTLIFLLLAMAACPVRADLGPAKAESNKEKRSRLALENADKQMDAADKEYEAGNWGGVLAALEETGASVDLALDSLKQSGKNPRSGGKHFKNAEIRMRALLRRIDNFRLKLSGDQLAPLDKVRDRVQRAHDELLDAILGRVSWE